MIRILSLRSACRSAGLDILKFCVPGRRKMPRIEPFEKHAKRYEEWFEKNSFAYQSELQAVKALLPKQGKSIEIGVGTGRFAVPLGISLGLEPSMAMSEIARRRGIHVVSAVAEDLPFHDARFDTLLMVTTVCFLDNIMPAFKEAYRVLKSGGSFIIGFIDSNSPLGKVYQKRKNKSVFYRAADFYSTDEIIACLKEARFPIFTVLQTIFRDLHEIDRIEPIKEGYGEGSFVVIKATRQG